MPISEIARSASSQAAVDNQRRTMFFSFVERALFITIDARTMATPFREIPNERHPAAAANPLPGRTTLKRLAAAIVAGCSLAATPALAQQVEPKAHKLCIEAKDYAGCVKAMTSAPAAQEDSLTPLRNAMKQVAARLRAGTSLRDSTVTFQPVVDQLAVVEASNPDALAVQKAKLATRLFDATQLAWDTRIKVKAYGMEQYGMNVYNCKALKMTVDNFNSIPGAPYVSWDYKKGLFGIDSCRVDTSQLPEAYMLPLVARVLDEGAVSPAEIAAEEKAKQERKAAAERERELCAMGPWNRYLEENPGMKKWVEANPAAAESTKKKFLANPKNQSSCSTGSWNSGSPINYSDFYK